MDTPIATLSDLLSRQRAARRAQVPDYAQRMDDLARLRAAFKARLEDFARTINDDSAAVRASRRCLAKA